MIKIGYTNHKGHSSAKKETDSSQIATLKKKVSILDD